MSIRISHPTNKVNFSRVDTENYTLWFSYETPIAIYVPGQGTFVRENNWGPTTGRHLNAIDTDRSARLTTEEFTAVMRKAGV